jgi:RNA polymerase sigma-70 factor (ECF subfamily)
MDPDRLGRLIDEHAAALELYARQWCDAPEDVVQEAFLHLSRQRHAPDNPAAWLFRAVRNGAINAATAARRRRRHETIAAGALPGWFEPDSTRQSGSDIDAEAVTLALKALPIDQREVVVAHLWGGLTFEHIAAVAGLSSSSAHRLYQSALSALRERLGVACRAKMKT